MQSRPVCTACSVTMRALAQADCSRRAEGLQHSLGPHGVWGAQSVLSQLGFPQQPQAGAVTPQAEHPKLPAGSASPVPHQ